MGGFPLHILCHDLRWCQRVRYNEPTFRTVTHIQPSTQEGLDAPWTTGAAQETPVDRDLKGFLRGRVVAHVETLNRGKTFFLGAHFALWQLNHWDKFDFSCYLHKIPLHLKRLKSLSGYERFAKYILKCSVLGGPERQTIHQLTKREIHVQEMDLPQVPRSNKITRTNHVVCGRTYRISTLQRPCSQPRLEGNNCRYWVAVFQLSSASMAPHMKRATKRCWSPW